MSLELITGIATIISTIISIISLFISSSALIKIKRITKDDHSKSISQKASGRNNKQEARITK